MLENNNNTTLTGPKELLPEATKQEEEEESVTAVVKNKKVSLEDMDTAKSRDEIIYRDDDDEDDEESLQPNNTSVNTFAALNITHATLNVSTLAAIDETADFSVCGQAMEDCCQATQLLSDKKYDQALVLFQQAVAGYEKVGELVASVNAGGCYRNMATVCRMLERYPEAERHLVKAQEIYVQCRDQIDAKNEQAVLTLDGKLLENSEVQGDVSADTCEEEYVCVDALILETMQSRALFYVKYQGDMQQAVAMPRAGPEALDSDSKVEAVGGLVGTLGASRGCHVYAAAQRPAHDLADQVLGSPGPTVSFTLGYLHGVPGGVRRCLGHFADAPGNGRPRKRHPDPLRRQEFAVPFGNLLSAQRIGPRRGRPARRDGGQVASFG